MTTTVTYDRIGTYYRRFRQPDARIAKQILAALGHARMIVDVGGGTGSYEPADRRVVAVEPSAVMLAQRAEGAAPAVQAAAEALASQDLHYLDGPPRFSGRADLAWRLARSRRQGCRTAHGQWGCTVFAQFLAAGLADEFLLARLSQAGDMAVLRCVPGC